MPGKRIAQPVRGALALALLGVALACGYAGDAKKQAQDSDALPDGAMKRFGSLRWRHGEPITFLAMPADGKALVVPPGKIRSCGCGTGKPARKFGVSFPPMPRANSPWPSVRMCRG